MLTYLQDAISACDQALRTNTDTPRACQNLGNALQMMGLFSTAMRWHTWAIQSQPDRAEMFSSLGRLHAKEQRWTEAIDAYEQALAHNPQFAPAYWSLANLYSQLGQPDKEIYCRQQAIQLSTRWATPGNQFNLGNRLMQEQRATEAIVYYQEALQKKPDFFAAQHNLALSLMQQGDWDDAATAIYRLIDLEPSYAPSHYALGQVKQQQGKLIEAQQHYQTAIELDSEFPYTFSALGEVCLQMHEWEQAVTVFRQAVALGLNSPWLCHNLGYGLLKQEQTSEAVEYLRQGLQQAVEQGVESPWFYAHLGEALLQQQSWDQAAIAFLSALHRQTDLPEVYKPLGRALNRILKDKAAGQTVIAHFKTASYSGAFYLQVAQQLGAQQQYEGAVLFYKLAIKMNPGQPEMQALLAQTEAAQKDFNQKIADHYWGIKQFPQQVERYTALAHLLTQQGELDAAVSLHRSALGLKGWQQAVDRAYSFTNDWFTHNIPVWTPQLLPIAHLPHLRALEIGCFEGMASCWLLDHVLTDASARLDCIDRYPQDRFAANVRRAGASERVVRWIGDSHQVLPTLEPGYDLIYISGCPQADHMRRDAELSWDLLKPGGILIFDYYGWVDQHPPEQRSSLGIDAFLTAVQAEVEVLHQDYQVIARKIES